ncbi:MAG: hypothetical protein A2X86_13605 [Bdellovibrionales bacterium GWA2_49_15]|nr:MAG: hypothetical protein A2X86_13605 [Bdellovibrionales bacterium GWA2_49_15]HAZ13562.1 hypothetical protein [Bdellovibrionales bacterium]
MSSPWSVTHALNTTTDNTLMSTKTLDRIFLIFISLALLLALLGTLHGILTGIFQAQFQVLASCYNIFSNLMWAFSLGTLLISTFYQARISNYVFFLSLLLLTSSLISTPFIFGLIEHVNLFEFITHYSNFHFLMSTGNTFKIYFYSINFFQLMVCAMALLLVRFDSARFFRPKYYSTTGRKIFVNTAAAGAVFVVSMSISLISPFYIVQKNLGFSIEQGNLRCVEKSFVKGDKKIVLLPMAHIGDASFYQGIVKDYLNKDAVFLVEGVKDTKGLIKGQLFYGTVAKQMGISEQKSEFKFPEKTKIKFVWADVETSELHAETIKFINLLSVDKPGETQLGLASILEVDRLMKQDGFIQIIFGDILNKRNERLFAKLNEVLPTSKLIVIAWGAAHIHDMEMQITKIGFQKNEEVKRTLTGLWKILDRRPASATP